MNGTIKSNFRPFLHTFYAFLIVFAGLCAMPRSVRAQLYIANTPKASSGVVSKYNAKGGEFERHLVNEVVAFGLAVKGNTLFVADQRGNTVGKYDATTGAAISPSFITRLEGPFGLAVSGQHPLRDELREWHGWQIRRYQRSPD